MFSIIHMKMYFDSFVALATSLIQRLSKLFKSLFLKENNVETPKKRRFSKPVFSPVKSTTVDEREKNVERILKKKRPTPEELQFVYEFLIETGKEKWRYVKDYEGYYRVSSDGMVESVRYDNYLDPVLSGGYYMVGLSVNSNIKKKLIHRLVAEAFIPNPNNHKYVVAKDGNYTNCSVANLEWSPKRGYKRATDTEVVENLSLCSA